MKKLNLFLLIYKILILLLVVAVLTWGLKFSIEFQNLIKTGEADLDSALGMDKKEIHRHGHELCRLLRTRREGSECA